MSLNIIFTRNFYFWDKEDAIEVTTDVQLLLLVVLNGFDSMVMVRVIVLVPEANIGPVVCQSALEYKRQNIVICLSCI